MTDAPTPPEPTPPSYPTAPPAYDATQHGAPATNEFGQPVGANGYPQSAYAHWGQRVGSYLLDALVPLPFYVVSAVGVVLLFTGMRSSYDAVGNEVVRLEGLAWVGIAIAVIGYLGALAFGIWNIVFRQGRTGWSIGKKVMGIRLIRVSDGRPMGAGMCFVRQLAHFFDSLLCYIGYLWPLWDERRQTFADKLLDTVVVVAAEPPRK